MIGISASLTRANGLIVCTLLRALEKFLRRRINRSSAQTIPHNNERDRDGEDQRGDSVDFGSDAPAQSPPDFKGQRVIASDEEEGHGDFVHGQSEDQQTGSN